MNEESRKIESAKSLILAEIRKKDGKIRSDDLGKVLDTAGYSSWSIRKAKESLRDNGMIHYQKNGLEDWYIEKGADTNKKPKRTGKKVSRKTSEAFNEREKGLIAEALDGYIDHLYKLYVQAGNTSLRGKIFEFEELLKRMKDNGK